MSAPAKDAVAEMTIKEQAEFLGGLVCRCIMKTGEFAGQTHLRLSDDDARALDKVILRLHRMAPFEDRIRAMVTGRRP